MSVPAWVLLGFAAWTVMLMASTVGAYRWWCIFRGQHRIGDFRADLCQGPGWYQRAMRAHANCAENLPVFGAIVLALELSGMHGGTVDGLSAALLPARMLQSLVHVGRVQTDAWAGVRFGLFLVQVVIYVLLIGLLVGHAWS